MKATESPLVELLKGPLQFLIPIYQRAYSWTEKQCGQLWEDVLRVGRDELQPAHFIGSVVYIKHGLYQATSIPQLLVIDEQQRLTTVTLIVEALARLLDEQDGATVDGVTARKLRNYYLLNPEEDVPLRYKLELSRGDSDTLRALLDGKPLPEPASAHVAANFEFFEQRLRDPGVTPELVHRGLAKLLVVDVSLDRDHDNPQLIFESLNSTGLDLSQSDLVRNFVLMGLEPKAQQELYQDHWLLIEKQLVPAGRDDAFDRFLRAWLALRRGEVPNVRQGYETFKRYRAARPAQPIAELVADLHRSAKHYSAIALGTCPRPKLAAALANMRALRVDAALPFLMHAYALYEDNKLAESDFVAITQLVESWMFRRAVCDIPSNVLSRTFASLPDQLDDEDLLESFSVYLAARTGGQRFPTDEEFCAALATRNVYEFKHRQHCLTRLENFDRKESVAVGQYTVEHVMPQNQNLSAAWRDMLGDDWRRVQEQWLHTLGNLSLTGYNSELSDLPFETKRDMEGGFADSPIRLHRDLVSATSWNEDSIRARGEALARRATSIWPFPKVSDDVLAEARAARASKKWTPRETFDHFWMSPKARALLDQFLAAAQGQGMAPTIWQHFVGVGPPGAGKPYPVLLHPRKHYIRLTFRLVYGELESPPHCVSPYVTRRGTQRCRVDGRTPEDIDACTALLAVMLEQKRRSQRDGPSRGR